MASLNKVFLMGNLTRDPELRYTPSGTPICEFGLAVNRSFTTRDGQQRDDTCFVDVAMWGKRGVVISEYFQKGRPIFIEGRLNYDSWEAADGTRRSKIRVVADDFQFIGGAPGGGRRAEAPEGAGDQGAESKRRDRSAPAASQAPPPEPQNEGFDVADDEIPF